MTQCQGQDLIVRQNSMVKKGEGRIDLTTWLGLPDNQSKENLKLCKIVNDAPNEIEVKRVVSDVTPGEIILHPDDFQTLMGYDTSGFNYSPPLSTTATVRKV